MELKEEDERGGSLRAALSSSPPPMPFKTADWIESLCDGCLELALAFEVLVGARIKVLTSSSLFSSLSSNQTGIAELMVFHPVDVSLNSNSTLPLPPQC